MKANPMNIIQDKYFFLPFCNISLFNGVKGNKRVHIVITFLKTTSMKNNIVAISILVLGSFLFAQPETDLQENSNIKQVESKEIAEICTQNIDLEEEEIDVSYTAVVEKSAIPLQIFDFFNIF